MSTFVFFSAFYLPHLGGVERYTKNLSEELSNRGNEVIVVTSALDKDACFTNENGLSIARMPSHFLLGARYPLIVFNKKWRDNWNRLLEISADFVLINTRYYPLSLLGLKYAELKKIPVIIIDHSSSSLAFGGYFGNLAARFYEKAITSYIKRRKPFFLAVSSLGAEWLSSLGIKAIGVLPNSINVDEFRSLASSDLQFSNENQFHVVYTGRLLCEKGVLIICRAVEELVEEGFKDIYLDIAGAGPLEREIEEEGHKCSHIRFYGKVDQDKIARILLDGQVFCLPTVYPEGFPTVLLEAAACDMGIIVTHTGGSKELVPDSAYGLLIDCASVSAVKSGILRYYKDRQYLLKASKNVKLNVRQNYSWASTADKLLSYCARIKHRH